MLEITTAIRRFMGRLPADPKKVAAKALRRKAARDLVKAKRDEKAGEYVGGCQSE